MTTTRKEDGLAGSEAAAGEVIVRGPAFEDLFPGQVFDTAPPVTLTDGLAAAHQAIVGKRSWLALSHPLAAAVLGGGPVAPPALVWNVSIGQSTLATQQVLANLYYRGLVLRRQPRIGDTLETSTRVTGLKQNRPRPGRPVTGLAARRITTRGGARLHLRSRVMSANPETSEENEVLDWRFAAVCSAADAIPDILHSARSLSIEVRWKIR